MPIIYEDDDSIRMGRFSPRLESLCFTPLENEIHASLATVWFILRDFDFDWYSLRLSNVTVRTRIVKISLRHKPNFWSLTPETCL